MPDPNEYSFEPHSDADLANILEQQLAQMRGNLVSGRSVSPIVSSSVWVDELFDVPTEEMSAAEIVAVRQGAENSSQVTPFAMPMMFSASEMQSLMVGTSQQAEPTSDVEQQLIDVLAEIEAIEAAKALRRSAEAAEVVEVVEVSALVDIPPLSRVDDSDIPEKRPVADRPSFDDLLFGTTTDE
ncbi:MAG: hypothetical protein JJE28_06600 [Actinomycetales bacterium]|nr:hypothetical protein [Actinomycetales bacterium]